MPDISMCLSEVCPKKKDCYRHEAKPDTWQSYSDFGENCKNNNFQNLLEIEIDKLKTN